MQNLQSSITIPVKAWQFLQNCSQCHSQSIANFAKKSEFMQKYLKCADVASHKITSQ